jgi:multimeric flavodoxin WrbA
VIPAHIVEAAKAVRDALASVGVEAECKKIHDTKPDELQAFDAIILGTPTHMEGIPKNVRTFYGIPKASGPEKEARRSL